MTTVTKYKFYSDAGHGWLAVKTEELVRLGISEKISRYSYQRGKTSYIEADGDTHLFIQTKRAMNERYDIIHSGKRQPDRSPIRSYDCYKPVAVK